MNSVKEKFIKLQAVFILLAVLVTVQLLILYFLQSSQTSKIFHASQMNREYMDIVSRENNLFGKIATLRDTVDPDLVTTIKQEMAKLRKKIRDWGDKGTDLLLIDSSILAEEYKRLTIMQKAFEHYLQRELAEADKILELEKRVFFDRSPVIEIVLDRLMTETKRTSSFMAVFFVVITVLNVPVFIILLVMTRQLFSNFKNDVNKLTQVAQAITNGEKYEIVDDSTIEETQRLLEAFRDMELELINRNMLSKDEVIRTKKSNKNLEQKVEKSNHELLKINKLLEKKNTELEQILYAASHDLRTPLIGVQGFSQELQYLCDILEEEITKSGISIEEGGKLQEILAKDIPNSVNYIINGSNKMDTMIQGLLRISRVGFEELKMAQINMNEFIRQIVDGLSFQAQSADAMIIAGDLSDCVGDKDKLEQVFTNLIVNAIKYRRKDKTCEINIFCEKGEGEISYIIADNSKGISSENLSKIFNTFFRIDSEEGVGEGLGLTIANRIVEKHNGRLKVESDEGEGSRFAVVLPDNSSGTSQDE